jgi:hypothetical protein
LHVAAATSATSFQEGGKKKINSKVTGWGTLLELPDILMVY